MTRITDNELWRTLFRQMCEKGQFQKDGWSTLSIPIEGTGFCLHWNCAGDLTFEDTKERGTPSFSTALGEAKIVFTWEGYEDGDKPDG